VHASRLRGLPVAGLSRTYMCVWICPNAGFLASAKSCTHFGRVMYGTLFAVAVTTGMRPRRYIGLKWQDIDRERRTVSVKRTSRKGPTGQWEYGETKRAGSRRIIRLQIGFLRS